jgi:hypothetical protein
VCAGGGKAFDPAQLFSASQADVINMLQRLMLALTKLQLAAQKDSIGIVMQVTPCKRVGNGSSGIAGIFDVMVGPSLCVATNNTRQGFTQTSQLQAARPLQDIFAACSGGSSVSGQVPVNHACTDTASCCSAYHCPVGVA